MLLEIRGDGRDRVLDVVPAESFTSRCTLRTNATEGKHAKPRPGYDPPPATSIASSTTCLAIVIARCLTPESWGNHRAP